MLMPMRMRSVGSLTYLWEIAGKGAVALPELPSRMVCNGWVPPLWLWPWWCVGHCLQLLCCHHTAHPVGHPPSGLPWAVPLLPVGLPRIVRDYLWYHSTPTSTLVQSPMHPWGLLLKMIVVCCQFPALVFFRIHDSALAKVGPCPRLFDVSPWLYMSGAPKPCRVSGVS